MLTKSFASLALIVVAAAAVSTAHAATRPVAKRSAPRSHVSGTPKDLPGTVSNASLSVDRNGDVEVLGTTGHGRTRHLTYFTKPAGRARWHSSPIARSNVEPGADGFATSDVTFQGKRVLEVYTDCHGGVYTTEGPSRTATLPPFGSAGIKANCNSLHHGLTFVDAAAGKGRQAAVLLDRHDPTDAIFGTPVVAQGDAGLPLNVMTPLPNPHNLRFYRGATAIGSDLTTRELTVIAAAPTSDGQHQGVYAWTKRPTDPWSEPTRIYRYNSSLILGSPGRPVAIDGHITVPMFLRSGPLVIDRSRQGKWTSSNITVGRGYAPDTPVLAINRRTRSVHAVFVVLNRHTGTSKGMFQTARVNGKWGHLRRIHRGDASPVTAGIDPAGHPIVGYDN